MKRFFHFIQYNNLAPISLFIVFGTSSLALASNEDVQRSVYAVEEEVRSVDNTYITEVDLRNFEFDLKIVNVTEDTETYFVTYSFNTITLLDYVWQEEQVTKTLEVSKASIVGKDLGLFIAKQVNEVIKGQLEYLQKVQDIEQKNGTTVKKVAKKYSGLIGRMFDPEEETFPGYKPVVKEKELEPYKPPTVAVPFYKPEDEPSPVPTEEEIVELIEEVFPQTLPSADKSEDEHEEEVPVPKAPTTTPTSTPVVEEVATSTPVNGGEATSTPEIVTTSTPAEVEEQTPPEEVPEDTSEEVEASVEEAPSSQETSSGESPVGAQSESQPQ